MRRYGIVLCMLLVPNTLFCADYFFAPNCNGLTDIHGGVNQDRLSSCVNELIDGINKTRQAIDSKNNETQKNVDDINYAIKSMNVTLRDLASSSSERMRSEKDADPATNAVIAKMRKDFEERYREQELKIKQLETRIIALEGARSGIESAGPIKSK